MHLVLLFVLVFVGACAQQNVSVKHLQLAFNEEHQLAVDSTIEYILVFKPNELDARYPSRVWMKSEGGDPTHPIFITYRQRAGAGTWQLPYESGSSLQYEFERTLCPIDSGYNDSSHCGQIQTNGMVSTAGTTGSRRRFNALAFAGEALTYSGEASTAAADSSYMPFVCMSSKTVPSRHYDDALMHAEAASEFSLHVVATCTRSAPLRVRATSARDWSLQLGVPRSVLVTLTAARVHYYRFAADESSVRLVMTSDDDVCATLVVQNYSCPIGETLEDVAVTTMRMTVQRSGGAHLARSRFPLGFYVVALVQDSDQPCSGEEEAEQDWLWQEIIGLTPQPHSQQLPRTKTLELEIKPSLSRQQYVVASIVTIVVFLIFYVAFFALVLAQRWSPFGRHVKPLAVLATDTPIRQQSEVDGSQRRRRRRGSDATFDSSDMSESDEEPTPTTRTTAASLASHSSPASPASPARPASSTGDTVDSPVIFNGTQDYAATGEAQTRAGADGGGRPFGLPPQLRLAALARRRERVLRARSDRYLQTLYTVAVFYALPVVQFVAAFQLFLNVSGTLDTCYYNFLCAHPAGALSDFNHVFSNAGYLLLGALFLLQVRRRRRMRRAHPRHEDYGIPAHYGLLEALGAGMMVVALLSASYHVCPNGLNFQFDTAFMYVLAVLSMVKIYQSRHPDVNARAHATFGVLAVLIATVVWGVLGGGALFWGIFTVGHIFGFLLLSLRIYYLGQFRFAKESLQTAALELSRKPLYMPRLVALLVANAVNWAFALYGLVTQDADFAGHLLSLLLGNTLLHLTYYVTMKLLYGERPRWYVWCYLAGAMLAWGPALYFFQSGSTDWSTTPAQSRHLNHECRVLQFYDSHDLWHFLSAVALYLTFNVFLTWDDGLSAVKKTDIAVF